MYQELKQLNEALKELDKELDWRVNETPCIDCTCPHTARPSERYCDRCIIKYLV